MMTTVTGVNFLEMLREAAAPSDPQLESAIVCNEKQRTCKMYADLV